MAKTKYIKRKDVYKMLHSLGGCGADPDTWADGWDKAVNAAISELSKIPTYKRRFVKCEHHWKVIERIAPDGWGMGGKVIISCTKCGKIKKVRLT